VFCASGNFHGRTTGVISLSTDPESRTNFGPFLPNVGPHYTLKDGKTTKTIRYNNLHDLEEAFDIHGKETAAFLIEPIQGEAG